MLGKCLRAMRKLAPVQVREKTVDVLYHEVERRVGVSSHPQGRRLLNLSRALQCSSSRSRTGLKRDALPQENVQTYCVQHHGTPSNRSSVAEFFSVAGKSESR